MRHLEGKQNSEKYAKKKTLPAYFHPYSTLGQMSHTNNKRCVCVHVC